MMPVSKGREEFLTCLEQQADELGPFARLADLEELIGSVPDAYRDSFVFGYIKGVIDVRQALGME